MTSEDSWKNNGTRAVSNYPNFPATYPTPFSTYRIFFQVREGILFSTKAFFFPVFFYRRMLAWTHALFLLREWKISKDEEDEDMSSLNPMVKRSTQAVPLSPYPPSHPPLHTTVNQLSNPFNSQSMESWIFSSQENTPSLDLLVESIRLKLNYWFELQTVAVRWEPLISPQNKKYFRN